MNARWLGLAGLLVSLGWLWAQEGGAPPSSASVSASVPAPASAQAKAERSQPANARGKGKGKVTAKAGARKNGQAAPEPQVKVPLAQHLTSSDPQRSRDFPDLAIDAKTGLWVVWIEHDGQADRLQLAQRMGGELQVRATVSEPGVLHQPACAADGAGGVWCFWSQVDARDVMTLRARRYAKGTLEPEVAMASGAAFGSCFADAATDPTGRIWVTWQEVRPGASRIWTRYWTPDTARWSDPRCVSAAKDDAVAGGHWEPRLAFTNANGAWIVYDSSAGSEFNLHLARVPLEGEIQDRVLVATPEYEARASISADAEGGLWIAAERGRRQWGLDSRGHENDMGFNAQKRILLGRYDPSVDRFTEVPVPHNGRPTPAPDPSPGHAVNVPSVAVREGHVWLSYRTFANAFWRVALLRYDPATKAWSEPAAVPDSTMGQDRHQQLTVGPRGGLWLAWPSDARRTKLSGVAAVHVAQVDTEAEWKPLAEDAPAAIARSAEPEPYFNAPTPPRPLTEHHRWTVGGKTYRLMWGDLHRHTDISNCRTGFDGCILEAYRYAYDLAGLDFLGTSDHTDVGKVYAPYEWWHTQRQVDVFHAPGQFASLYAYEREQTFPWGHRNIVFTRRGGPLVYIQRDNYRQSPWQATLPIGPGLQQITPAELWDVLRRHNQPCAIISHTGATGMGTDWTKYPDGIDNTHENTVEIYQGARVSYEGLGAPQPTVGLRRDEPYTPTNRDRERQPMPPGVIRDFEAGVAQPRGLNNGVYQKALQEGHKLGVFASSDHIATHTSFGGVYVEEFTREGLIAGFKARRTCAATDKIFVEFSSHGHAMGEAFTHAGSSTFELQVLGTAPIRRVTIVRNEQNHHVFEPTDGRPDLRASWTDPEPLAGENRYYLRIEQADGNMAWSSPLWITRTP